MSYIRFMDKNKLDAESDYPAYIAYKDGSHIPQRFRESGIMLMSTSQVGFTKANFEQSLKIQNLFNQVYKVENSVEIIKARVYTAYVDSFTLTDEVEQPVIPATDCNCDQ